MSVKPQWWRWVVAVSKVWRCSYGIFSFKGPALVSSERL